jgi:acyl carrier protein
MKTIFERVGEILMDDFGVVPEALRDEATFDDLDLDSLAQVELGEVLGKNFEVDIADDEFAGLQDLSGVIGMLRSKGATG